jgi:hypothetical protein
MANDGQQSESFWRCEARRALLARLTLLSAAASVAVLLIGCNWFSDEARFLGRWEAPGEALDLKVGGEGLWQRHNWDPAKQRVVWAYWRGESAVVVLKSKFNLVERVKAMKKGRDLPGDDEVIVTLRDASSLMVQQDGQIRYLSRPK